MTLFRQEIFLRIRQKGSKRGLYYVHIMLYIEKVGPKKTFKVHGRIFQS